MNLVNFRDLGGITTTENRRIKPRRLLRSGEIVQPNKEAIAKLVEHDLKLIVDFRSEHEAANAPTHSFTDVQYINYDIMADSKENTASRETWLKMLDPDNVDSIMKGLYRDFAISDAARSGYTKFIRDCINSNEGAVLFHCAAGKDRTGFAAAILMKLLGVGDEDIQQDYLKTNAERKEANEHILEGYKQKGLSASQLIALNILYSVKEEYLQAAFEAIDAEYGSFEEYVKNGLSVADSDIELLRGLYLE